MNRRALIVGAAAAPLVAVPAIADLAQTCGRSAEDLLLDYVGFLHHEMVPVHFALRDMGHQFTPIDHRPSQRAFVNVALERRAIAALTAVGL